MPRVDGSVWRALKRRGQAAHGTTPFAVAATCWAVVLGQHARQDEVMVGAAVHGGRERAALARTVGYLVNTVALRIDLRGSPDVDELFSSCGATVRDALAHSDGMWATVAAATMASATNASATTVAAATTEVTTVATTTANKNDNAASGWLACL